MVLLLMLAMPVGAAEGAEAVISAWDVLDEAEDYLDVEAVAEAAQGHLEDVSPGAGFELDAALEKLDELYRGALPSALREGVKSAVVLLAIVLLCALCEPTRTPGEELSVPNLVGALAITAQSVTDVRALVGLGRETIGQISVFSKSLLPVMAAASAAGGQPGTAATRQLATMLFSDVLLTLVDRVLLPLVYTYLAACAGYAALGNEGLSRMAAAIKWAVTTVLTGVLLLFVGYLTVTGVISGGADAMAIKAAKVTISGMVPVVGGILSDAAETVLAGAGILRGTVGVYGMLAVISICVTPFVQLGGHYLAYKGAAALSASVSEGRITWLIGSIGGALGLVLGMTGACALLLLISLVSAVSMAAGS